MTVRIKNKTEDRQGWGDIEGYSCPPGVGETVDIPLALAEASANLPTSITNGVVEYDLTVMTPEEKTALGLQPAYQQDPVKDKDLTAPPGGEAEGDRYIVAAGATGLWAGKDENIATYSGGSWVFTAPIAGMTSFVIDEGKLYGYTTAWALA